MNEKQSRKKIKHKWQTYWKVRTSLNSDKPFTKKEIELYQEADIELHETKYTSIWEPKNNAQKLIIGLRNYEKQNNSTTMDKSRAY